MGNSPIKKAMFLGHMVNKMLKCHLKEKQCHLQQKQQNTVLDIETCVIFGFVSFGIQIPSFKESSIAKRHLPDWIEAVSCVVQCDINKINRIRPS